MMQPYIERRRMSGINNPWYRQPHKLMLAAALMWVGSVMYLASLAHAILRTHKETSHMMMGSSMVDNDENFKQWLESQGMLKKSYGSSASDEHVTQWLESRSNNNKYGASGETNEDFQKWLESQNKYGASSSSSSGSSTVGLGDAYQDWLQYLKDNKYGASSTKINSGDKANNVNVRFGNNNAPPQEWLEYQTKNEQVKYSANGMYDKSQKSVNNLAASRAMAKSSQSLTSDQQQQRQPVTATSDSSVSTIDWPLQGMPHASCTNSNGCSSSSNVTVLIVYGPEYHTHISEMAWNVATGVHTAFQNHIKHHPSSPMHGHIVYGHTGNVTFLDVMDADAIIIGSPVYNGNVHPDVQNWINYWHIDADLENKFGGAFATAGGIHAGADGTIMSILRSMMVFQMMAVGGDSWTSPFGAVATMYEVSNEDIFIVSNFVHRAA